MAERRMLRIVLIINVIFALISIAASIPEQGITTLIFDGNVVNDKCDQLELVTQNTKFAGSYFHVDFTSCTGTSELSVKLAVLSLKCANSPSPRECLIDYAPMSPDSTLDADYTDGSYQETVTFKCEKNKISLATYPENFGHHWLLSNVSDVIKSNQTTDVIYVPKDGIYQFIISVTTLRNGANFTAVVESRGSYGYLSAADWPQLPFFRTMFVIYLLYSLMWLVLCCCHRSDLLRIQYWIGGVIFIGLIEKAVFLGEYETLNKTGQSVYGAIILGELVSSAKKMLSRTLVIIVSVGFGIVKPRLGTTLHKVLAVGLVYFIACSIEGCLRAAKERVQQDRMAFIATIVLSVVDAALCWWIFAALIQTMRTLRLRRNIVKLSLYRHFTNTLIFAVLASIGFMIWSFLEHQYSKCVQDWKELWVDEAFWHLLFVILLLVIMILWRPSVNNQRYAYSALTDTADDEAEEPMINDAFDGIKMRGSKSQENSSNRADKELEDDLKWVDDNIPASLVDSALPSILDSEEEIVTTAYERGKMQ